MPTQKVNGILSDSRNAFPKCDSPGPIIAITVVMPAPAVDQATCSKGEASSEKNLPNGGRS
jgi:hypothetical protein